MTAHLRRPTTERLSGWLATAGVGLIGVATFAVVASRWADIGHGGHLAVALAVTGVVAGVSWLVRDLAPRSSRSLASLVAALVPIDAAAAALVSGSDWRGSLVVAGPVAVLVAQVMFRRGHAPLAEAGMAAGVLVGAAGAAATHGLHGPAVAAAVGLLAALWWRGERLGPAIVATVAGLAPVTRMLEDAVFTGGGTLREFGLVDSASTAGAVSAALFAGATLGFVAIRRASWSFAALAAAVVAIHGLDLWALHQPPVATGYLSVVAVLVLVELAMLHPVPRRALGAVAVDLAALTGATLTLLAARWAWLELAGFDDVDRMSWTLTAAALGGYWALTMIRRSVAPMPSDRVGEVFVALGVPGLVIAVWSAVALGVQSAGPAGASLLAASTVLLWAGAVRARRDLTVQAVAYGIFGWWSVLAAGDVSSPTIYLAPLSVAIVWWASDRAPMRWLVGPTLLTTAAAAIVGQAMEAHVVDMAVLAAAAGVVGAIGVLRVQTSTTAWGIGVAVAAGAHAALDRGTGASGWAWFAVAGAGVVAAAVTLEAAGEAGEPPVSSAS